jgi:hypothetical protein
MKAKSDRRQELQQAIGIDRLRQMLIDAGCLGPFLIRGCAITADCKDHQVVAMALS